MDTSAMTFVTDETFDEVVGKSAIPVLFVMGARIARELRL